MGHGLLIIGAGGNGKVVADIAQSMQCWDDIAFIDEGLVGQSILGLSVLGGNDRLEQLRPLFKDAFISIANIETYDMLKQQLMALDYEIPTLIHPSSIVAKTASIAKGTMVSAGAIINPLAVIEEDCIINTGAIVEHDCHIGVRTHVAPAAAMAGNVRVGKHCWVGLGARMNENINVCANTKLGTGAVVNRDITEPGTYVGVPARKINNKTVAAS